MINPSQLDIAYEEFSKNLHKWLPDGVIPVTIGLLDQLGLLASGKLDQPAENLSHLFQVIEAPEKITLYNEQFAVWIIPSSSNEGSQTLTLIALLHKEQPHLELAFASSGVYNAPKYILKVLQHFLTEVLDTETIIKNIEKKKQ
jgi:hypothetical protein